MNTEIAFTQIFDRVVSAYNSLIPEMDIKTAANHILELELTKGRDAVKALFGFMRWIEVESNFPAEKKESMLKQCLFHDISGRFDKWEEPRSSSYIEFVNI